MFRILYNLAFCTDFCTLPSFQINLAYLWTDFQSINTHHCQSAHIQLPKNGTKSAWIQKWRPLFTLFQQPPKISHLLYTLTTTFGRVISKIWKIALSGPFWAFYISTDPKIKMQCLGSFWSKLNSRCSLVLRTRTMTILGSNLKIPLLNDPKWSPSSNSHVSTLIAWI